MSETTLRKLQAVAGIGSGIVVLHGITSDRWQRRHTFFAAIGMATSLALFVLPLLRRRSAGAPSESLSPPR